MQALSVGLIPFPVRPLMLVLHPKQELI